MHITKESLYEKIKNIQTKEEFEKEIKHIKKQYNDLFDEETCALLIVDKLGKNKENICKISGLEHGMECTVFGKVTSISKTRNFNRKNGTEGRVINLEISDGSGSCNLVLWDKDVELVKNKTVKKGANVKVINGYIKNGYSGIELNIGRWGLIEIAPEGEIDIKETQKVEKPDQISGELTDVQPTRAFFKDDGEFGFVRNITVKTKKGPKQLTLWDDKVKEAQNFKAGDKVEINNIDIREKNGKTEIHLNGKGNIKKI
jgi:replication factor A1